MKNLYLFELKSSRKQLAIWTLVIMGLTTMYMSIYPAMFDQSMDQIAKMKMSGMPEGFLKALNMSSSTDFTDIMQYISITLTYVIMGGSIFALLLGVNALSKEEANHTIVFLGAQPISRNQIITAKALAALTNFTIFALISAITLHICTFMFIQAPNTYQDVVSDLLLINLGIYLIGLIFLSVGLLFGACIKTSNAAGSAFMIFFVTYVIGVFSKLIDKVKDLIYLSPTDYFVPLKIIEDGFETKFIVLTIVIILFSVIGTYIIYNRRDLKV